MKTAGIGTPHLALAAMRAVVILNYKRACLLSATEFKKTMRKFVVGDSNSIPCKRTSGAM